MTLLSLLKWTALVLLQAVLLFVTAAAVVGFNDGHALQKEQAGDHDGAIRYYDRAIFFVPFPGNLYHKRGMSKQAKGDLKGAEADYSEAIRRYTKPEDRAFVYVDRGAVRRMLRDYPGSLADLDQAILLAPLRTTAYYQRAWTRREVVDLSGARADYTAEIRLEPRNASIYIDRGTIEEAARNFAAATADYNYALWLDARNFRAYTRRSTLRLNEGDRQGAWADANQALALKADYAPAYDARGYYRIVCGDLEAAAADLDQAARLDPGDQRVYSHRSLLRMLRRDWSGALADLRKYREIFPTGRIDKISFHLWLCRTCLGEAGAADAELAACLAGRPSDQRDDWMAGAGGYLLGSAPDTALFVPSSTGNPHWRQDRLCTGWFLTGTKKLLAGDRAGADEDFRRCVATGQTAQSEYLLARAELEGR